MERSTIIRHVTLILWNMNITSLKNHETDLYLDCVFCKARRGRRRTAVHYEASVVLMNAIVLYTSGTM